MDLIGDFSSIHLNMSCSQSMELKSIGKESVGQASGQLGPADGRSKHRTVSPPGGERPTGIALTDCQLTEPYPPIRLEGGSAGMNLRWTVSNTLHTPPLRPLLTLLEESGKGGAKSK